MTRKFLNGKWALIYCPKCLRIKRYSKWYTLTGYEFRELSARITNNSAKCIQSICPECEKK